MQNKEWSFIDKSSWGIGAWQSEPDKAQWTDETTALPCLAVRHPSSGHWCGYVGVAEGHPLFNVPYGSCPQGCAESWCDHRPEGFLDVHGGITFSDYCQPENKETGICHIPEEGEPDRVYWLGFDCAHSGDTSPAYASMLSKALKDYETYRELGYVKQQCAHLATQLIEVSAVAS